jgi:predicted dehydrogenase
VALSKLRWGFIGTGWIADVVSNDLDFTDLQKYAVSSRSLDTAQKFAESHGFKMAYGDYREMLADPNVDVIYVATLNQFHFEHAQAALRANKHVLLEKPFTINTKQAKELISLAQERDLFLLEAMWEPHLPMHKALEQVISDGLIGELQSVTAEFSLFQLEEDGFERMWHTKSGGGTLMDLGIYPLHFVSRLLGPKPLSITASAQLTGEEGDADRVDEQTTAILKFAGRKTGIIHSSMSSVGRNVGTIMGSLGRVEMPSDWWQATSFKVINHVGEIIFEYEEAISGSGRQYQFLEAERCIEAALVESPVLTHDDTLTVMASMDEIRRQIGVKYQWD